MEDRKGSRLARGRVGFRLQLLSNSLEGSVKTLAPLKSPTKLSEPDDTYLADERRTRL